MENAKALPLTLSDGGPHGGRRMSAGERLREMRGRAGLSLDKLAKASGYAGASSLQKYQDPDRQWIDFAVVQRLAAALVGKGSPPITIEEVHSLAGVNPVLRSGAPTMGSGRSSRRNATGLEVVATEVAPFGVRDLPVLGEKHSIGDEYFFGDGNNVVSLTNRPAQLFDVKDAYAVYVHDDSMVPRFRPGEMVYVDPVRPVMAGDDVVIQMKDGRGFIKELVRRTSRSIVCRQHNPPREMEFPAKEVRSVHQIILGTKVRA